MISGMPWALLASQFSLQLGLGLLVALGSVTRAPVGRFFYRMTGATAFLPIAAAAAVPPALDRASFAEPRVWCAALALLALPWVLGGRVDPRWRAAWAWGVAWSAAALAGTVATATELDRTGAVALATASAIATGCVAGSVSLAMVLGHWYLTVPKLDVAHLARLNRLTVGTMLASLVLLGVTCLVFAETLNAAERPLLGPWGLFYLGTRVAVGLLVPLLFAWMTAGSLRFHNTRSATGILYASTILVLIGTAAAVSLQDSYGVPL
jgi:hypothetical protein